MNDKYYIINIERKLCENVPLNSLEIRTIIAALRESKNCLQEPYYEVVYHDEYGKTESRIMNPVCRASKEFIQDGYDMVKDRFEVNYRRIVRKEGK